MYMTCGKWVSGEVVGGTLYSRYIQGMDMLAPVCQQNIRRYIARNPVCRRICEGCPVTQRQVLYIGGRQRERVWCIYCMMLFI